MHLLGNADVSKHGGQIAFRLAGDVFTGHAVVDDELAVVSVSRTDCSDLNEREMLKELKGCSATVGRQEVYSMAQLNGSQEQ